MSPGMTRPDLGGGWVSFGNTVDCISCRTNYTTSLCPWARHFTLHCLVW